MKAQNSAPITPIDLLMYLWQITLLFPIHRPSVDPQSLTSDTTVPLNRDQTYVPTVLMLHPAMRFALTNGMSMDMI